MSTFAIVSRRIVTAAAGIGILAMGMATMAQAAPAEADQGSASAPAAPGLPVPVLHQPLDASSGLLGIPRGAIPGIGTTQIHETPGAEFVPGLEIVPLPKPDAPAEPTADATGAEAVPAG